MSLPVRPPIFPRVLPRPFTAPLIAGPAEAETLDKPSEAFDWKFCACSVALDAVSFAASVALAVVDSHRRPLRTVNLADCRSTARDADNDIIS